jgi:hypothetical protein
MKIYFCDVCEKQIEANEERGHEVSIGSVRFADVCSKCTLDVPRLKQLCSDAAMQWARERKS